MLSVEFVQDLKIPLFIRKRVQLNNLIDSSITHIKSIFKNFWYILNNNNHSKCYYFFQLLRINSI